MKLAPVTILIMMMIGTAHAADLTGRATITDGDTIRVAGKAIRIWGIAAPEKRERGGRQATAAMAEMLAGQVVSCRDRGQRTHGRIVASCRVGDRDVGEAMVRSGWARDCPRYSGGQYAEAESASPRRVTYPLPSYCIAKGR